MYDFKQEFLKQLKIVKKQIQNAQDDLEVLRRELSETDSLEKRENLKELIFSKERFVYMCKRETEFLRPGSEKDYEYRLDILSNFFDALSRIVPRELRLRFHGTSIYFAREIIESGEISCSQDRFGYSTSFDLEGHISVTTVDTVGETIQYYIDLNDFCMPAGCVFVLLPSEEDGKVNGDQMKKVDFKTNPSVLFAIITTPENIPRVREWCKINNIDEAKVCDFQEFLNWEFDFEKEGQRIALNRDK